MSRFQRTDGADKVTVRVTPPAPAGNLKVSGKKPKPKAKPKKVRAAGGPPRRKPKSKGAGGRPRKGEEKSTLTYQKPWLAMGIGERTYFRKKAAGTLPT